METESERERDYIFSSFFIFPHRTENFSKFSISVSFPRKLLCAHVCVDVVVLQEINPDNLCSVLI